jgi:hypothetical protein
MQLYQLIQLDTYHLLGVFIKQFYRISNQIVGTIIKLVIKNPKLLQQ